MFSQAHVLGEHEFQFISPPAGGETLPRASVLGKPDFHLLSCPEAGKLCEAKARKHQVNGYFLAFLHIAKISVALLRYFGRV